MWFFGGRAATRANADIRVVSEHRERERKFSLKKLLNVVELIQFFEVRDGHF